jgi:phage terminase large subunit
MTSKDELASGKIYLPDVVGKGYGAYWRCKTTYRVCKGSRASKKSKTTALNFICRLIAYPQSNLLVVRKTFRSLKDSCFTELKWAIHRLGLDAWFNVKESPLEIIYIPTGQKILFRGLDDPLKVASIAVEVGALCWMWIEEAYEIGNEADFDTICESIRGDMPPGLFRQITLTFNPWNDKHWLKRRFFDSPLSLEDVSTFTTTYRCNEWLSADDLKLFETMKKINPRRYAVAGLGDWGRRGGECLRKLSRTGV